MSRERAELSKKNPYHIPRYRYYELKYFCRQYDDWKKALTLIDGWQTSPNDISGIIKGCPPESPTERIALSRVFYSSCIDIVDKCIAELDTALARDRGRRLQQASGEWLSLLPRDLLRALSVLLLAPEQGTAVTRKNQDVLWR